jgi:UDP-N-acetylmuramate--alanine ligase
MPAVTDPSAPGPGDDPTAPTIDLSVPQAVHIVGVGGSGMSAIATVLAAMGHRVSGSDLKTSKAFERLRGLGIDVTVGHDNANVPDDAAIVTRSTAIPDTNPEIVEARRRGVLVASRAQILAAIAATRSAIAVAGTHGKTTTSSMLAMILIQAGLEPSFIIGGDVTELATGAAWGGGEWFVIEADESDGTFLTIPRRAAVVTNIEADHLEHWGGFDRLHAAFEQFLAETDGPRIVCADDELAWELGRATGCISYGTSEQADYRMTELELDRHGARFALARGGEPLGALEIPMAGRHNALNAAGAAVAALELGAPFDACVEALASFGGVARRFQNRGEANGIVFVDDYAHLPSEIEVAIDAAVDGDWHRVVVVFQPHRYSRTESLWATFGEAFRKASVLVVTDIYSAGERPRPGISGSLIVQAVLDAHPWQRVVYLPHRADIVSFLAHELRPGDLCLTLGAGDLTTLPDEVLARLQSSGATAP